MRIDPLTARITIRLTAEESERVRAWAAASDDGTVSAFARARLLGHPVRPAMPRVDRETVAELRRIGGLIKHVAVDLGDRRTVGIALDELTAAVRRIIG